jgi:hypothetical protein
MRVRARPDGPAMNRPLLYAGLNVAVATACIIGSGLHRGVAHPIYVLLLFAICSIPILQAKPLNGRYALAALWCGYYFVMYGALDLQHLVLGADQDIVISDGIFDMGELVILVGAALFQIAYRAACRTPTGAPPAQAKDWSERSLVLFGLVLWVVAARLSWQFSVNLMYEKSNVVTQEVLASLGPWRVAMYITGRMALPVAIMMLAYAQCRYRRPYMLPIVIGIALYQLFYGFVIDTKSEALIGCILVLLTNLLITARIPKFWLIPVVLVIFLAFPVLQANRVARDEHNQTSHTASQHILKSFEEALHAKDRVNSGRERAQTALERTTTKGSVELIVSRTGVTQGFQHGYTLLPLLTAFIPRIVWPDKPSIPTGQIMNHEFHVSEAAETFISPSHLGELYWNFGWPGILLGIPLMGFMFGTLGRKFDLAEAPTITRLLVLVVTVRLVVLGAEGEIATGYVTWMRSLVGIGLLHLVFARIPYIGARKVGETRPADSGMGRLTPFPNLLR